MNLAGCIAAFGVLALAGCAPQGAPEARDVTQVADRALDAGELRGLLNAQRAPRNLLPLSRSGQLTAAAGQHAADMSAKRYFSHRGANGSTLGDRVRAQGYGYCVVAENISQGYADGAGVIAGWMASPGHRRNILNPGVTEFGVARAPGNYWVLVLARPGC